VRLADRQLLCATTARDQDLDPDMAVLLADISERMIRLPEPRERALWSWVNRALDLVEEPDQDAGGDPTPRAMMRQGLRLRHKQPA